VSLLRKGLSNTVKNELRAIVREEMTAELGRILNPTFIRLVTEGYEEMGKIFDAVVDCDRKHDDLAKTVEILQAAVEDLQRKRAAE
jgi:hypothetical protein